VGVLSGMFGRRVYEYLKEGGTGGSGVVSV
jgi:hypothetical protein